MRWLVLFLLGCSGSGDTQTKPGAASTADTSATTPEPNPCAEGDLVLTPVIGTYDLAPLQDNGPLIIQQGAQGGYHVDVGGTVSPVPEFGVLVIGTLTLNGDILASTTGAQVGFDTWRECEAEFRGGRIFMDTTLSGETLCGYVGQTATFDLEVEELKSGRTVSQSYQVVLDLVLGSGSCASL